MERTKQAIVDAFEALLDEKPFNKITVKDIVERCGVNRNTFYYHYPDIPALLEQMMGEKLELLVSRHYTPDTPMECIRPLFRYGIAHRREILHLYRYVPREKFLPYLDQATRSLVERYFAAILQSQGLSTPKEDVDTLVYFYKCTMVGILLDWLDGGMEESVLPAVERICELLEGAGERALLKYRD